MPRVGQLPDPQGGTENERAADAGALKLDNCFASFFEPQFGQAGLRAPVTSTSKISRQSRQTYSKSGMGRRTYSAARRASISTFAWRMPTKSAIFRPSLKITR